MSQADRHREPLKDDPDQQYDSEEPGTPQGDDPDQLIPDSLADLLSDSLENDWEVEEFESDDDFYDELRERCEDDDPL